MIAKLPFHEDSYLGCEYRDEELLEYMIEAADHFGLSFDPDCFEIVPFGHFLQVICPSSF